MAGLLLRFLVEYLGGGVGCLLVIRGIGENRGSSGSSSDTVVLSLEVGIWVCAGVTNSFDPDISADRSLVALLLIGASVTSGYASCSL